MKMKISLLLAAFLLPCLAPAAVAESHYEVYFFHASWRCENCDNAEKWVGEVVDALKKDNPGGRLMFIPKQLETNKELVSQTNAKRVDLFIAEIDNGRMVRFENLGNMLRVISSKQVLMKHVVDSILIFDAKVPMGGQRLKSGAEYTALRNQAAK